MIAQTNLKAALTISVFFVVLAFAAATHAKIIYVDDDAPGANDGSSWEDAFTDLQDALELSNICDEILIAGGIYTPAPPGGNRWERFRIKDYQKLRGGYAGAGTPDPGARDIELYETILSGDLNGDDDTVGMNDNSYCVVYIHEPVGVSTVLDGLTITAGFVANYDPSISPFGAGLFTSQGSPTIVNCTFTGNYAHGYGYSSPGGAAIYTYSGSPVISNCTFRDNHVEGRDASGAGLMCYEGNPVVTGCKFIQNTAVGYNAGGAGISTYSGNTVVSNCTFRDNHVEGSGAHGAGLSNNEGAIVVIDCEFIENTAVGDGSGGAGLSNYRGAAVVTACEFIKNSAVDDGSDGAGLWNYEGNITVTDCSFTDNFISGRESGGSGMFTYTSVSTITRCIFSGNHGAEDGGGLCTYDGSPAVTYCSFTDNSAEKGGGMYSYRGNPTVRNCLFAGNSSEEGGALWNYSGAPNIINCTITSNTANREGGGIWNYKGAPAIVNTIMWLNIDQDGTGEQSQIYNYSGSPLISHSWIAKNPLFLDPENGDYHLSHNSPCINAGDPNLIYDPHDMDFDGKPRIIGCRIDMGIFEYSHVVPAELRIVPNNINLANKTKGITAYLWPPEGYIVSENDFCILFLEDQILPEQLYVDETQQVIVAEFNHEQLQDILKLGEVELKISAQLTDANCLEGTDEVKVIYEGGGKFHKLGKASDPDPADGATEVSVTTYLRWTAGSNAVSHDVYFGTNSSPPFVCNQTATLFRPGTLAYDTTYFWRINEVNNSGITKGHLWSFTTMRFPPPPPPPPPLQP